MSRIVTSRGRVVVTDRLAYRLHAPLNWVKFGTAPSWYGRTYDTFPKFDVRFTSDDVVADWYERVTEARR